MWSDVLIYAVPAGVSLYGLLVLITGEVSGFGSREARGAVGRLLGLVLASALPLAITLGPLVRIGPFARKPDLTGYSRDAEILGQILEEHRRLEAWRKEHPPATDPEPKGDAANDLPIEERTRRIQERARALEQFNAEYRRQAAETDARVEELRAERARIREDRKGREEEWKKAKGTNGPLAIGVAVLLTVWTLAWLAGRPPERAGESPTPDESPTT